MGGSLLALCGRHPLSAVKHMVPKQKLHELPSSLSTFSPEASETQYFKWKMPRFLADASVCMKQKESVPVPE